MDSTFVLKINKLYAELQVCGIKKTESPGCERLIFLLIHFLSPYFQPTARFCKSTTSRFLRRWKTTTSGWPPAPTSGEDAYRNYFYPFYARKHQE
jgi:hypothetical protein